MIEDPIHGCWNEGLSFLGSLNEMIGMQCNRYIDAIVPGIVIASLV